MDRKGDFIYKLRIFFKKTKRSNLIDKYCGETIQLYVDLEV